MLTGTFFKIAIPCLNCDTLVTITTTETDIMFFKCDGCGRMVITIGNVLFSGEEELTMRLLSIVGSRDIGRVLEVDLSTRYSTREPLTDERMQEVKNIIRDLNKG